MPKRPTEDMKPGAKTCPHCGGGLHDCRFSHLRPTQKRCPVCRCRWRLDGKHVIAGPNCPLQQPMPLSV